MFKFRTANAGPYEISTIIYMLKVDSMRQRAYLLLVR